MPLWDRDVATAAWEQQAVGYAGPPGEARDRSAPFGMPFGLKNSCSFPGGLMWALARPPP